MRSALALLLLAPLASADVRVVSPSGPYTQIQDAVNAANDGDLVLVHAGTYAGFLVQSKSLTIVADTVSQMLVFGAVKVTDLAVGQSVALIRLRPNGATVGAATSDHVGLYVSNNLGSIRCQECSFFGSDWNAGHMNGYDAIWIESSSDVSLVSCQARGGYSYYEALGLLIPPAGGRGANCLTSTITMFDTVIEGGWGGESISGGVSGDGGTGLLASGCTIFCSDSFVWGGQGGFGAPGWAEGGAGGTGANLNSGSMMHALSSGLIGGLDGDNSWSGGAGPNWVGGTYDFMTGTMRTLTVTPNPVRELQHVSLTFHGAPGEQVYLLVGLETAVQWDPLRLANFLIAPPQYRTLLLGTTNASGDLIRSLPFGDLGGTTQSRTYFLQPLFSGAGGAQQLGTPVTLAVLDSAF